MTITRLYGLAVQSDLPLHQDRALPQDTAVDFRLRLGAVRPPRTGRPHGETLLHLDIDRQFYTATRTASGYTMRFYGTCDILIDPDLSRATIHPFPDVNPGILGILAGGTLIAFVLAMRGAAVLHASAVQIGDCAVAMVGASGMGKSTTATLLCADGARLITDDLLRLDLTQDPPTCWLGATEVRLRKSAGELAGKFRAEPGQRRTADERDALATSPATRENLPLQAVVIPAPDKSGREDVVVERQPAMTAFLMLSRFPRLLGWEDARVLRNQFQQLGELVEKVPVYIARLPWGPPFPSHLAASLRDALGVG